MSHDEHFGGKGCVVTGAASGIGEAVSGLLLNAGATVFLADRDEKRLASAMARMGAHEGRAIPATVDVTDAAQVERVVRECASRHGRLDFLFNNAGIGGTLPIGEATLEQWRRLIDVNLWGVIHGVHAAIPLMRAQRGGHVVNTASIAGLIPFPYQALYCATKYAVVGLSESLRFELADDNIRFSVVCPGDVATAIYGTPILGEPVEVKPPAHAIPAADAARTILEGVVRGAGIIILPEIAQQMWDGYRTSPGATEEFLAGMARERRRKIETTGKYY